MCIFIIAACAIWFLIIMLSTRDKLKDILLYISIFVLIPTVYFYFYFTNWGLVTEIWNLNNEVPEPTKKTSDILVVIYYFFVLITVLNFVAYTFFLCILCFYATVIGHAICTDASNAAIDRTKTLELIKSLKTKVVKVFGDNCCSICMEEFVPIDEVV